MRETAVSISDTWLYLEHVRHLGFHKRAWRLHRLDMKGEELKRTRLNQNDIHKMGEI